MKFFYAIKSLLIIFLATLTVYQVGHLWLVNLTNRNFALYLQARFPPSTPDGQSAFAQPYRIISGTGNGVFDIRYSNISESDEWIFGETAINTILRHGEFDRAELLTLNSILARRVLIFEYAFLMNTETFAQALARRSGAILADSGIGDFTSIVMQLPDLFTINPTIYFVNNSHVLGSFTLTDNSLDNFPVYPVDTTELHYVRTDSGFVPRIDGNGFFYSAVAVENPFSDAQGLFTLSHIRSRIETFFDNPASIFPSVSVDNVYTFSNRNTMVRYLENAVLEYTSYRTIGRAPQENFMADFSSALAFVKNDPFVINEIYLASYDDRGRANIFRFNYVIDNMPLILTEPWATRPNCTDFLLAPIEITVDQGRVVRYRRIVYNFHKDNDGIFWKDAAALGGILGFPISGEPLIALY